MTQTPKRLLRLLDARDGHVCAWTGVDTGRLTPQHRANRGMGGAKCGVEGLVWLDSLINGLIESDEVWAMEARRRGIKISRYALPALVPVWFTAEQGWFLLLPDGSRQKVQEAA